MRLAVLNFEGAKKEGVWGRGTVGGDGWVRGVGGGDRDHFG